MATLSQIAAALRKADEAGDVEAATRLARAYREAERSISTMFEPPKKQAGFTGAFKDAITSLGLADEAAAYAANPTEENRQEFLKKAESRYKSVGGFGKGENWEAFKELLGGSLGALVAPIAGGIAGAAAGPLGGIAGFAGTSAAQYNIQNLRRQAEEQQAAAEAGLPVPELSLGKAAAASAAQAGLDVVPGALILKGLSKFPLAQRLLTKDKTSNEAAQVLIDAFNKGNLSLKGNVAKGVGLGVAFEVPQEIAQQALERWQAGLSLTDDEAKEEFKQAAIGAAILGGGFGAIGGYATYRGEQAARAQEQADIEASMFGAPAEGGIPADLYAQDEARRVQEQKDIARSLITPPVEGGIPFDMFESEADREARLEREAIQEIEREEAAARQQLQRGPYSARTLREAAEAEALAPREEEEPPLYTPPKQVAEEEDVEPSAISDEDAEIEAQRQEDLAQMREIESRIAIKDPEEIQTVARNLLDKLHPEINKIREVVSEYNYYVNANPVSNSSFEYDRRKSVLKKLEDQVKNLTRIDSAIFRSHIEEGKPFKSGDVEYWSNLISKNVERLNEELNYLTEKNFFEGDAWTAFKQSKETELAAFEKARAERAAELAAKRASTEGVMEGLGAPVEGGIPAEMLAPTPRETALEVIKTTPTIKAVAEATGLNQPKAAAIMRQFVDEGILERKGNKFVLAAPEAIDVPSAPSVDTETDGRSDRRSPELLTLESPTGELGAVPTRPAGLDTAGDVTERVDEREGTVPPALEAEGALEGLGAPTEGGIPAEYFAETRPVPVFANIKKFILETVQRKGNVFSADLESAFGIAPEEAESALYSILKQKSFKQKYQAAQDLYETKSDIRTRALDFIRQTGKGGAFDLQKALGIELNEAKALRKALLGSGAVVQATNVRAAKTAEGSYRVVEGDYVPTETFRRETGQQAVDQEQEAILEEARQRAAGRLRGEGVESETERIQREADKAAEFAPAPKLRPTYRGVPKEELAEDVRRAFASLEAEGNAQKIAKLDEAIARAERQSVNKKLTKEERAEQNRLANTLKSERQQAVSQQGLDLVGGKGRPTLSDIEKRILADVKSAAQFLVQTGKMSVDEVDKFNQELRKPAPDVRKLRKMVDDISTKETDIEVEEQIGTEAQQDLDESSFIISENFKDDVGRSKVLSEEREGVEEARPAAGRPLNLNEQILFFRKGAINRFKKIKNPQIYTDKFKAWFKKSKIVDDVGDAATWYTGSPVTDIEAFRTGVADAIFASPNPNVANQFTFNRKTLGEGVVYPVFIRAENPFDYDNPTHVNNLFNKMLENAKGDTGFTNSILNLRKRIEQGSWQELEMPIVQRAIKALGHDGFYVFEYRTKNLGVYSPNQIKSATGNIGAFSVEDERIRFSKKPKSHTQGMKADSVRSLIGKITAGWKNPPNFIVVQSHLDLPQELDPEANADSMGVAVGNDVYIIADNIRLLSDLKATVFHESLGHYGLEQLFGERLLQTMLDIYRTNNRMRADADAWLAENPDTYPETEFTQDERRALATEEVFAEMSESGQIMRNPKMRSAYNRVAALIRKFARALSRLVGRDISYTNAEINDIIAQAHNKVISGKTRLVPRYNNIRYMKGVYNRAMTGVLRKVQSGAPGATQNVLTGVVNSLDNIPEPMRNFKLSTFSLHHMMQLYERYAPSIRRLNILVERMAKDATDTLVNHEKKTFGYRKVLRDNPNSIDAFNNVANFINISQAPVLEEQLNANGEFVRFVPNVAAQQLRNVPMGSAAYNALTPEEKVLHQAVNQFYALPADMQQAVADIYTDYRKYSDQSFKVKLEQFLTRLPPTMVAAIKKKYQDNRLKFYLPLRREGTYKLTYQNPDTTKVSKFLVSEAERNLEKEKALANGATILDDKTVIGNKSYESSNSAPTGLLKELGDNIELALRAANASQATINETKQIIFDTFVDYMPGTSGNDLRQEINSRVTWVMNGYTFTGRLGAIEDVVGVYEKAVPRMIYQINNLKYTMPLEKTREKINEQFAKYNADKNTDPKFAGLPNIDPDYVENVKSDLDKRIKFAKNPIYSNYVYALSKANYIYSIALNISSALINTTILPMMAWPSLAAKYGIADATKAVGQAMAMFFRNSYRDPATGRLQFNINPTFGNGASGEFAQLHRMLEARSVTGTSAEQELQQAQNITVPGYEGLSAKVNLAMSYVFRSSERFNREVTAIAAYMLARNIDANGQRLNPNRGQASARKATEEAIRLNYDINGATLPETNSRLYQNDIGRIILTFRTHALNMILNLAFTFNQAIETINANQPNATQRKLLRSIARKKLLYVFGSTYMLAGIKGLPLFGAAEVLASLLMGDDDEPYDLEQMVLDSVGTLGLNGPVNELLNVDIASRTGFYGLLWRDDPKRLAEVGIPVYVLERIAGPTYGLVEAARRGFNDLADGELVRASEALTPAPIRNMIKGMRYGIEGAQTRDGLPIVEDVSAYNSAMQILGFAPADLATAQAQRGATYQVSEKLKNRRVALLTNLYAARKADNAEAMQKALEDIQKFNASNPSYRITGDTINKSYNERERRAREAIMGVYQPRSLRIATSEYVTDLDERDGL